LNNGTIVKKIEIENDKPPGNILGAQNEIKKLQIQEDRLVILCSEGKIEIEKFEGYVAPVRQRIKDFKEQIFQTGFDKSPKSDILLPSREEVVKFAKDSLKYLKDLSFTAKQLIIRKTVNYVAASRESLSVYGLLNINELQHVFLFSEGRNCWFTKRREKHSF